MYCVRMCVCMYVCMYVCIYVCTHAENLGTVVYPYVILLELGLEHRDVGYTNP